jgi:hypothetical protein
MTRHQNITTGHPKAKQLSNSKHNWHDDNSQDGHRARESSI